MCRCPQAYKKTVCIHNELNTDGFYIFLIRFISDKFFVTVHTLSRACTVTVFLISFESRSRNLWDLSWDYAFAAAAFLASAASRAAFFFFSASLASMAARLFLTFSSWSGV